MQDKHFEIWYFTTAAGVNPVRDYINGKDDKARQKIRSVINLLQVRGHELAWPFVKHLRGRIRELISYIQCLSATQLVKSLVGRFPSQALSWHIV